MICDILGLFVNTLTADDKYPVRDCGNLLLPIQRQLSEKRKTFSQFFVPFLESTSNFKHFEEKVFAIALLFLRLQTVKDLVRPFSKICHFRKPSDIQHVKGFKTLLKST